MGNQGSGTTYGGNYGIHNSHGGHNMHNNHGHSANNNNDSNATNTIAPEDYLGKFFTPFI